MIKKVGIFIQQIITILMDSVIGLIHLAILSALGFITFIMGFCTILMPIFGLVRAFGARKIFVLWDNFQVPTILGVPIGLFFGIVFALITWISFRSLMKYFNWLAKKKGTNK